MREDLTEVAVVLDRSGSMEAIRSDAIGGFNAFLAGQKAEPGELRMTVVLFNHEIETIHARVPVVEVPALDERSYVPSGTTALLDAFGRTIDELGGRLAALPESERPAQVIVALLTDGLENASRDYTLGQVRRRVRHQQTKYGWVFLFLAAGQDAVLESAKLDIPAHQAFSFAHTAQGIREAHDRLNEEISARKKRPTAIH